MPRLMRRSFLVLALLGAWALLARDHAPLPFTVGGGRRRSRSPRRGFLRRRPQRRSPAARPVGARVFTKVVIYVKDNYVDPKRMKPKEMMVSALE